MLQKFDATRQTPWRAFDGELGERSDDVAHSGGQRHINWAISPKTGYCD